MVYTEKESLKGRLEEKTEEKSKDRTRYSRGERTVFRTKRGQ